ncbi:NAD/NADP octopine/nopaline dehydrogenase family protein [Paludicola sp. MB14-C6]|uniref:NAD/NADP-dependent octopine/nopaline dehydrogenase family protein n=1 Tax=Paludihabitans sp. MB14-C6 TaxID=3070656 RepID=UPI0027DCC2AA|nr:NAD/NADP-dependent octopine/nopaline dehydrogenase family protein [Paludicola sp. MB14-C6]WMJ21953.1 NAD/NADP octopine/nopaline dehydrogenase family protein [Paludicola sp. MB14-C6]
MNVCVIGGGNIGTAIAAIMNQNGHEVYIKTRRPEQWSKTICYTDMESQKSFSAHISKITHDSKILAICDIVLITTPTFTLKNILDEIKPHLKKSTPIGIIPGTGGVEFIAKNMIEEGHIIFGLDRVPCIARVTKYGKNVSGLKKHSVRLCAFPKHKTSQLCDIIQDLFQLHCFPLDNYLTVTFTPSNPILHTTRLYAMYQNAAPTHSWKENVLFYEAWDDLSSQMLIACDTELQAVCKAINKLDLTGVVPLTTHYESHTIQAMTHKISNILSFKGITSPMIQKNGRYVFDLNSRYFTEDFPYGLCIIKGFAEIFSCKTPNIDIILQWYQHISGQMYFTKTGFNGPDLTKTAIPQNFGIHTKEDVYTFYQ